MKQLGIGELLHKGVGLESEIGQEILLLEFFSNCIIRRLLRTFQIKNGRRENADSKTSAKHKRVNYARTMNC